MTSSISQTRKCSTCGKTGLTHALVEHRTELKHDGTTYTIEVPDLPAIVCPHCSAISLTNESLARLDLALHEEVRLMPASKIAEHRRALGMQKRELAFALRMAPETITRFEKGTRIQSASYDLLMQLFLSSGHVRRLVSSFHAGYDMFQTAQAFEPFDLDLSVPVTFPTQRVPSFIRFAIGPAATARAAVYCNIPVEYPAVPLTAGLFSSIDIISHGPSVGAEPHKVETVANTSERGPPASGKDLSTQRVPQCFEFSLAP